MITKIADDYIEKRSSLLAGGAILAGGHMAQNALLKYRMGSADMTRFLARKFRNNVKGIKSSPLGGEAMVASHRALLPEMAMLDKEVGELGTRVQAALRSRGIDPAHMSIQEWRVVGDALKGNFKKLILQGETHNPVVGAMLSPLAHRLNIDPDHIVKTMSTAAQKGDFGLVKDMEKMWKGTRLTNKTFGGMGAHIKNRYRSNKAQSTPLRTVGPKVNKLMQTVGDIGGLTTIYAVDPITGGVNAGKKFLASDKFNIGHVKAFREGAKKFIVDDPTAKGFHAALEGQRRSLLHTKPVKAVKDIVLNPITADIHQLGRQTGEIMNKHHIVPKILDSGVLQAANAAKKMGLTKGNLEGFVLPKLPKLSG